MTRVAMRIDGNAQAVRDLARIPRAYRRQVLDDALGEGGAVIEAASRQLAPKRSGLTARSIVLNRLRTQGGTPFRDVEARGQLSSILEFGTAPRSWESGKSTGSGPARPFMRPAADRRGRLAGDIVARRIRAEVLRLARRT